MLKKSTAEFIISARKVHGDKYDYSHTFYDGVMKKVCIICPKHGEFYQTPNAHLSGKGCPSCSGRRLKTQEEFLRELTEIHGDKYDYSKVEYRGNDIKVCLICPTHGEFYISPNGIINSHQGCPKCGIERRAKLSRLTQEEFINRAKDVHRNKYIYDKVKYRDSHTPVCITCPVHGDFQQLPYHHLNGHGCKKCATEYTRQLESVTLDDFLERAKACHTIKYDYSKVELKGMHGKVCIICPIHGEFWQTAQSHLKGCDCPLCGNQIAADKRTKDKETFIKQAREVHGDRYDYSVTNYITAKKKCAIRCIQHNFVFFQKPNAHLNGNGCPICSQSYLERTILRFLRAHKIRFEVEKAFDWLRYKDNMFLDFFLPDYGVAIECQGEQHFHVCDFYGGTRAYNITRSRDELKKKLCMEHGIEVLYFSNLGIKYPYEVFENPNLLLKRILSSNVPDKTRWSDPELPFVFDE